MQFKKTLEIKADHKLMVIDVADILYIKASVNDCYIHVTSGSVYKTRSTLEAMEAQVGEYFLKVYRTYLVCIMAIHALEDTLTLINGEEINYATRRKKEILAQLLEKQKKLAGGERVPLTGLIGNTFGRIFSNMDDKWLCTYERATQYGEHLEIMAYSPEIWKNYLLKQE